MEQIANIQQQTNPAIPKKDFLASCKHLCPEKMFNDNLN